VAKSGTADDNVLPPIEKKVVKKGAQEDGTYITSSGEVLEAKNKERREPYPEPEDIKPGHEEVITHPDGSVSFLVMKMDQDQFAKSGFTERKRQKCDWKLMEVYAGQPRPSYSYDELEQVKRGELKK
jgi:hypothetical protein